MKRNILSFGFLVIMQLTPIFSQTNNVKTIVVEIHNVIINGGILYVSSSFNETAYKKQTPNIALQFEPTGNIIRAEITVPIGECVINVYQDRNGNGKCDTGLFGIPKEPVGISNWDGKGPPGSYNKLKVEITYATNIIRVNLYQL